MFIKGFQFLNNAVINQIVNVLADELEISSQQLPFLARTPIVDADDGDITGKYKGQVIAADLIADDQAAAVYESGRVELVTNSIPNLKVGQKLSQGMLNTLARFKNAQVGKNDASFLEDWQTDTANRILMGIRQRVNALICAMQLDSLSYNRLGITLAGQGWGMPADLKVTVSTGWDDATNSTPITDIMTTAIDVGAEIYGESYDRVTMTHRAFKKMTESAEFQNRVKGELRYNFGTQQINTRDYGQMLSLASNILGMQVEVYDGVFYEKSNTGATVTNRALPYNKVILSSTVNDNDRSVMDFANGIVTETVVANLTDTGFGLGESFGPVAYFMPSSPDLNPPAITAWGVMRGFPRKHRETATACLTVGSGNAWA